MMLLCSATVALAASGVVPLIPVQRTIAPTQTHVFELVVPAAQYVSGVIDQGDADLAVTVLSPGCEAVARSDARSRGPESVSFIAETGGTYQVVVKPSEGTARRSAYRLQFGAFRPATTADRSAIEAGALSTEAKQILARRDRESLRSGLEHLERVLPLWHALGVRDAELWTRVSIGETLYALNEHGRAEDVFREARPLSHELADRKTEAQILNGLAMIAWPRGDIGVALDMLQEAVDHCRAAKFQYGEAAALSNRGIILWEAGQYDEAHEHYRRALAIVRAIPDRRGEAFALNNLALLLDELGRHAEALGYLARAVALFRLENDALAEGRTLVSQARLQLTLGEMPSALRNAQRGLTLIRRSRNELAEADGLRQLGRIFERRGDRSAARTAYESALTLYQAVGSRRGESEVSHALGLSSAAEGDCITALSHLRRALALRRASGLRRLTIESMFQAALAERTCGTLEQAQTLLAEALIDVEQLRSGLFEKEQRTSYLSSKLSYYSAYVDVLMDLHRRAPDAGYDRMALEASERARARELIERLRETWDGLALTGDAALLRQERELRRQINYWSWQVWQQAGRPEDARDADLRTTLDRLLTAHAEIEGRLQRADPRYAALLRSAEAIPLSLIQQEVLEGETVLVEYALGPDRSYVWAITRDRVVVGDLPKRADVERQAVRLHRLLRTPPANRAASLERRRAAAALGRLLLAPVASSLGTGRIVVVADGALHYVPFAALMHPTEGTPLIATRDVLTVPAATMLALVRREESARARPPKMLAALADPVFDTLDPRVTRRPSPTRIDPPLVEVFGRIPRRLNRLAFAGEGAQRILALVPPESALKAVGFAATRELAMGAELTQYRIIHFDTHAIQDDRHPELSGIVLSLIDSAGKEQDGFLRLHDIYSLRLRADVVVLAACRTGVGPDSGSEGLASLARGFLSAGATRVASALWDVDDEATAELMARFYDALLGDTRLSPAAALRAAQLTLQKDPRFRDPFYWAGFVLQGVW